MNALEALVFVIDHAEFNDDTPIDALKTALNIVHSALDELSAIKKRAEEIHKWIDNTSSEADVSFRGEWHNNIDFIIKGEGK
jgi:hypothetical protein